MFYFLPITDIYAREILDSRGNPTIEVEVLAGEEVRGRGSVPSGASTGRYEAVELRDGGKRYGGLGVQMAVDHVNGKIAPALIGMNVFEQTQIDQTMIRLDGTKDKSNLGANAILGVSMAVASAAAKALKTPLYRYLGGALAKKLPLSMMNILNGGKHADNTVDFQEFMILPVGASSFREGLSMCGEVYHHLKGILKEKGMSTAVGDEGGFAPNLPDAKAALQLMTEAALAAGYRPGKDMAFALDAAASELYDEERGVYYFPGESQLLGGTVYRSTEEMLRYYETLISEFPIISIEDGLAEDDWEGWAKMTCRLGEKVRLVGDDLFVTNPERLRRGIHEGCANAILVKMNQIGTVSEAMEVAKLADQKGYDVVVSHRSGETEDTFIADLAVAVSAGMIKTGAPCRGERTAKYNQLLRIEEELEK